MLAEHFPDLLLGRTGFVHPYPCGKWRKRQLVLKLSHEASRFVSRSDKAEKYVRTRCQAAALEVVTWHCCPDVAELLRFTLPQLWVLHDKHHGLLKKPITLD